MDTTAQAAWLAAHTFLCPHLRARLTPAQCAANRARPDVTDASAGAWESMYAKEKPLRPSACGACQDWEALAGAVGTAEAAPALYMPENLLPGLPRRELPAPALPASQGGQAGQIPPASRRGGFQPRGQNLARAQATYGEALPAWQAMPARVAAPVAAPEPAGAVPLIPAESIEAFRRATLSLRAAQAELAVARDRMRAGLAELTAQVDESLDAVTRALARYEVARVLYETLEETK